MVFEVSNIDEAQGFCDKVNARINNERFVRDMPHIDEGPRNTVIAGVIAGILAVVLVVVCFTGHPYSKQRYKLSPAEISRIHENAMNKAQKEAEEKVAADQAKKQEEQAKKDQENQRKQAEQQSQQQNAERDAAKQTAQRILATDTLSKQGLVNKMVAQVLPRTWLRVPLMGCLMWIGRPMLPILLRSICKPILIDFRSAECPAGKQ